MQRVAPGLADGHFRRRSMVPRDVEMSLALRRGIVPLAIMALALLAMLLMFTPKAQAQAPSTPPGVEAGITPPPDLDSAERGDPVEEEQESDQGQNARPANLPDDVDTAQRGDPVAEGDVSGQASTAPTPTGLRVTA